MSTSRTSGSYGVAQRASTWQDELENWCSSHARPSPSYSIVSDRRGKRTAWSCTVVVPNGPTVDALYWYDGQYVNGAKEDAAEQACRRLGIQGAKKTANGIPSMSFAGSKGRVEGWGTVR